MGRCECTCKRFADITGFGVLGHLVEMIRPSAVDVDVWLEAIPLLRHRKARLVVSRDGDRDAMIFRVEADKGDTDAIGRTVREITKLGGAVEMVTPGSLPNDGLVIADERDYSK